MTRMNQQGGLWLATAVTSLITVLLSFMGRVLFPGRLLADPVPLVLSFTQLFRGFLYWNWQRPLLHLLFVLAMALLAVLICQRLRRGDVALAGRVARLTAVINIGIVAVQQVDAFVVGVYYLIGGVVSTMVAGTVAEWVADWFRRNGR